VDPMCVRGLRYDKNILVFLIFGSHCSSIRLFDMMCLYTVSEDRMKRPLQTLRVHKKRKRAKRLHWSTRGRYRQAVMRRVFHLPTRSTLTYAEAQRFVDVYIDGSISRLNILEPLCVVDERDIKKYNAECCTVQLASETKNEVVTSSLSKGIVTNGQQVRVLPRQAAAAAAPLQTDAYYRHIDQTPQELNEQVEYDTDEQVIISVKLDSCADFPNIIAECHILGVRTWGAMTPTFELGRDFRTVHLPTKFYHPMLTRSEVIMLTNRRL